jgi:hypothetical protein
MKERMLGESRQSLMILGGDDDEREGVTREGLLRPEETTKRKATD